jgi:hypothetical protein
MNSGPKGKDDNQDAIWYQIGETVSPNENQAERRKRCVSNPPFLPAINGHSEHPAGPWFTRGH